VRVGKALITFGLSAIAISAIIALFALFVISAEHGARERKCFNAGGRVEAGVCVPVSGAITFEERS